MGRHSVLNSFAYFCIVPYNTSMKNPDKVLPKVQPHEVHLLPLTDVDVDYKDTPDVVIEKINSALARKDIKLKFIEVDAGGDYHSFMIESC